MKRTTTYTRLFDELGYVEVLCGQDIDVLVHESNKQYKCIVIINNYGKNTILSKENLQVIHNQVKANPYFLNDKEFVFLTIVCSHSKKDKVRIPDYNVIFVMNKNKTIYNHITDDFLNELAIISRHRRKEDMSNKLLKENQKSEKVPISIITPFIACLCVYLFMYQDNIARYGVSWSQLENDKWYSLLTYSVFHNGWMHLAGNMISFLSAGLYLEKRIGYIRYSALLIVACIYGGFLSAIYHGSIGQVDICTVGLSGVIYGIIGCMIVYSIYDKCFRFGRVVRIIASLAIASLDKSIDNVCHIAGLAMGIYIGFICINFAKAKLRYIQKKYYNELSFQKGGFQRV